ncbi:phist protein [Plasmodium cynomolgi strain B]|uniref:Phist protein n=1 Tax=Plasmodium cynomolgi (strain B) TaxID=1120755 RepID=K6UQW1_PLACD|nr:phist protein [Plasmodium cynomolgi strain B]GAB65374.1 phist protein [Plasmodium cynomolgi strain B]
MERPVLSLFREGRRRRSETKLMSGEGCRRVIRLGRILGGFYGMPGMEYFNSKYEQFENEPEWEECSYIGRGRDEMDHHFDQMRIREEWLRRGKYRPRNSYDTCPYGCTDADLLKELSEAEVNERLAKLGDKVSVKEMFILWSNVHRHERKKYTDMQERAKIFCDHLGENFHIPEEVRIRAWMKVYRCMTSVFLRFEKRHRKHFLMFLRRGPSTRTGFLNYIHRTRRVWKTRRMKISNYWRSKMVGFFRWYWDRRGRRAPGGGVREYGRVGAGEYDRVGAVGYDRVGAVGYDRVGAGEYGRVGAVGYDRVGAGGYDSRGITEQDRRYVSSHDSRYAGRYDSRNDGLNDRRDSSMYGSVDGSLYGSRDSVMCESRDGGADEGRNDGLGESRNGNLYGSTNEGLDESGSGGLYGSTNEGLDESRSEGLYESMNEGLDESRSEGLYDSRSEGLYDSMNEGLDESRSEGLNKRMNGGMEKPRGEDNA